jgi:hypothetical protein
MDHSGQYSRIGGWLILVGIGVVLSPFMVLFKVIPVYGDLIESGAWDVLTTPGSSAYDPLWAPCLYGEIGINAILVVLWCYLIYLFFSKKRRFRGLYIFTVLVTLTFIIADAYAIKVLIPDEPAFDLDTTKDVLRSAIASAIWVPYMLVSKRVAGTFVH